MISVRMTKDWEYDFVDINDEISTRKCPRGLVLEFEEEVAASAIASGHAETLQPPSPVFADTIRVHKRWLDLLAETGGDMEQAAAILEKEEVERAEAAKSAAKTSKRAKQETAEAKAKADEEAAEAEAEPAAAKAEAEQEAEKPKAKAKSR